MLKKDGQFRVYSGDSFDFTKFETISNFHEIEEADEVFYRDSNYIITSDETEDIIMDNHLWGCEDYSLDDAIVDVLSGKNEYEWPEINIDFIYNGRDFYSFTL